MSKRGELGNILGGGIGSYKSYVGYVEEIRYKGGVRLKEILVEYSIFPSGYRNKGYIVGVTGEGYGVVRSVTDVEAEETLVEGDVVVKVGGKEYDLVGYLKEKGCEGVGYLRELQVLTLLTGLYSVGGVNFSDWLVGEEIKECEVEKLEIATKEGMEELGAWCHTIKVGEIDLSGYEGEINVDVLKVVSAKRVYVKGEQVKAKCGYTRAELAKGLRKDLLSYECGVKDRETGERWHFYSVYTRSGDYVYKLEPEKKE